MRKNRRFISILFVLSMLLALTACKKAAKSPESESAPPATSEVTEVSEEEVNVFGDAVFTKEEVNAKISEGLSDVWETYELNAMISNLDALPDNVKETMENAFGAYRWENYAPPRFGSWEDFFADTETGEDLKKVHAVMDLYGVYPGMDLPGISKDALAGKVNNNPQIDMSQYATYEDGDAYLPYFSYYGCEVLGQNDHIKIEGVRDITIDPYEQICRTVRISNISDTPVLFGSALDKDNAANRDLFRAMPEYEEQYDLMDDIAKDDTVLTFTTKDVLKPGEITYLSVDYSSFRNFNTHWLFTSYAMTDEDVESLTGSEQAIMDVKARVRNSQKGQDIALILKNRVTDKKEWDGEYATIKGVMYNEDGERLPFMPFFIKGLDENLGMEERQLFTSVDGSFSVKVPLAFYKTDETYARYMIYVSGERAPIDGKMVTMVVGELYALNGEVQEGKKYSDFIKDRRVYGQKSEYVQPTEAKDYVVSVVVPDKPDYLVYDYASEEDYGGQANYYDYGGDIIATVKFHDDEPGANATAYLNVFDHDGKLLMRKPTGVQTCCVCVSPDGTLVGSCITPAAQGNVNFTDETPGNIGHATIFDRNGNKVFELNTGTRAMEISHDNKYVALDVNGGYTVGIMDIDTKEILWEDYRGEQIRFLIFSEDDSVLYMGSQECIAAYEAKTGKMIWQTFLTNGFPIDMILSSKYLYASPKGTGGNDNKLCCIDRKSGEMVWTFQTGSRATKLTVSPDETILFWGNDTGARDHGCYMLDAETGSPLWSTNYGAQAAWFTSDSEYVAIKAYSILEVFTRDGVKIATTACGANSKMSWFVYLNDDLSRILNIAGGGADQGQGNSGWMYNMTLVDGYDREFIEKQLKKQ